MSKVKQPIGILGGTFDPIHYGHLRIAWELKEQLPLSEVRLIPCHRSPLKQPPIASPTQRLSMVKLAIEGLTNVTVDDCELRRAGVSYTVDTLLALKQELINTPLCLIIGMDAFSSIKSWHRWEEILTLAHLIVVNREGSTDSNALLGAAKYTTDHNELTMQLSGLIYHAHLPAHDISATVIRERLRANKQPLFLLPEQVLAYINQQQLYTKP